MSETKRLYRSRSERMIAGVCGGIGEYFNIDPTLVRLLFVAFTLAGGSGVLAYIIFLVVVPEEPQASNDIVDPVETDFDVDDN
ncbi:MAG: PspC domain-containing protein [Gammaproteobacteria bacterium]|nr:PspC domain-containing protein [Gammaproteobacteria bacterium]